MAQAAEQTARPEFNVICKPDRGGQVLEGDESYVIPAEYRVRDCSGEVIYLPDLDAAVQFALVLQDTRGHGCTFLVREA